MRTAQKHFTRIMWTGMAVIKVSRERGPMVYWILEVENQ